MSGDITVASTLSNLDNIQPSSEVQLTQILFQRPNSL